MSHDENHEESRWLGPDEPPQFVLVIPIMMGIALITTVICMVAFYS